MEQKDNPIPPHRCVDADRLQRLVLPPPLVAIDGGGDAFEAAIRAVEGGAEAGALFVGRDPQHCELALVLVPDRPRAACVAALPLAMVALADALGALGPPLKPVGFAWPTGLVLDGARFGSGSLALGQAGADGVPDWLVLGLRLRLRFADSAIEPGARPDETALYEEGFGEVAGIAIVESFARHFRHWLHRWQEEGPAPLAARYRAGLVVPKPASVRIEVPGFDLVHLGPPPRRERLVDLLFSEVAQ